MSEPFDPRARPIIVRARVTGPLQMVDASLALDTDATTTLISPAILVAAGYDPNQAQEHVFFTGATALAYVPKLAVDSLEALGIRVAQLRVLVTTLPPSAGIDGLLGLDFFHNKRLTIDFRRGQIELR